MQSLVGVKFKNDCKLHLFNPETLNINIKDKIIVDTELGIDLVEVIQIKEVLDEQAKGYPKVIRIADKQDIETKQNCKKIEKEAFQVCIKKIKEYKLKMILQSVDYRMDHSKLLFYFTSDERIDFRDMVKDLAAIYKTRIELRQIGVKDEIKRCGGYGICGRQLCCCSYLTNCPNTNIKMAKEQNLSLNPYKISGICGKLMCCLNNECEVYQEKLKDLPTIGSTVKTRDGQGEVIDIQTLREIISVKIPDEEGFIIKRYCKGDYEVIFENISEQ